MMTNLPTFAHRSRAFSGVNLLIVLALALCGLVAWQWKRETALFSENQKLKADLQRDHETKHQQTKSIENLQGEITRIEDERKQSKSLMRTNELKVTELARQLAQAEGESRSYSNLVSYYRAAFERATNQLNIANSNMIRANEVIVSMRKAVDDRNEIAVRLNDANKKFAELMTERNEIVEKFSAYVKQVEADRGGGKK